MGRCGAMLQRMPRTKLGFALESTKNLLKYASEILDYGSFFVILHAYMRLFCVAHILLFPFWY